MGTGRKRIQIRKIENLANRRVTFCKRRNGLFNKSRILSTLTPGCRVAVLAISTSTKPHFVDTHDDSNDFVSFLEQAADAVFQNPNSSNRSDVPNSNPSFEIGSTGDCLRVQEAVNPFSNPNFEVRSTGDGYAFPSPSFETIGGDQRLEIELIGGSNDDEDVNEASVSISCAAGDGGSFSTMTDDLRQVRNIMNTADNVWNENALPRQILYNSTPPLPQSYSDYDHSVAYPYTMMNFSSSTDMMQMPYNMAMNHADWNRHPLSQEFIRNSPSCPQMYHNNYDQTAANAYTDDLIQVPNNIDTNNDVCSRDAVTQQIIVNRAPRFQQCYQDYSTAYLKSMNLFSSQDHTDWNRCGLPQEIIHNSPSCPPIDKYYYDQTTDAYRGGSTPGPSSYRTTQKFPELVHWCSRQ